VPTRPAGGCTSSQGCPSCESARSSFGKGRGPRLRTSPCRPNSFPSQSCRTGCSGPASRTFRSCTSSHWPASRPYTRPAVSNPCSTRPLSLCECFRWDFSRRDLSDSLPCPPWMRRSIMRSIAGSRTDNDLHTRRQGSLCCHLSCHISVQWFRAQR